MGSYDTDSDATDRPEPRSTLPAWLLRLVQRDYRPESEIQKRHRQMVELIWSRGGLAERYFVTLQPHGVSFGQFTRLVTELVCRGLAEGWIRLRLPAAPSFDDDAYAIEIDDPERFVTTLELMFEPSVRPTERRRNPA